MSGETDLLMNGAPDSLLAQTPPAEPTAFDDAMKAAQQQESAAFRSSVYGAFGVNPDKAAKAAKLAGAAGVDPAYVERNLDFVESRVQVNEVDRLLNGAPRTRQWLTQPINAQVAGDSYESLGLFEKFWNELKRSYYGTTQGFDTARAINAAQGGSTWRYTDPDTLPLLAAGIALPPLLFSGLTIAGAADKSEAARQSTIQDTVRSAIATGAKAADIPTRPAMVELNQAKTWGEAWAAFAKDPLGLIFDVTAQSAAQLAVTVGATALTGPAGGVAVTGLSSFGQEFLSGLMDNLQELGVDTQDQAKLTAALQDGALMEKVLSRSAIKGGVVGALDAASLGMARMTVAPFIKAGIGREATNVVAQMLSQAALGAGGEALGSVAAGRPIQPGAVLAEAIGEFGGAPLEVAGMRWRTGAARTSREAGRMESERDRAESGLSAFDKAMAGLVNNPLAKRAPGALGEFVGEVTGPDANVFLPAERVREFFQTMPPEQAQATMAAWGIAGQLTEALAIGGDVVMPVSMYAQHVAAPGLHTFFKDDFRLTAAGMSLADVANFDEVYKAFIEGEGVRQGQDAAQDAADLAPAQRVFDDVVTQAQNAGFTPANARQYAALYAARYATRAARMGGDAWEQYARSGVELRQVLPESVRAVPPDQMDLLLNAMRKGKGAKVEGQARRLLGDSLLEFVSRKGGVVDDGGELGAMDADKWHRKKVGWGRLVQDKAKLSLDDMALDAWEAGYFPEFTERPTIDDLLEAMRDELGGRERRPMESGERPWQANYVDAARDMDEVLNRLGLDLQKSTNQQIKDALRNLEAVGGDYEQRVAIDLTPGGGGKKVTIGATTIDYGVSRDGQTAEIILVKTAKESRGEGSARRALESFLRETDRAGLTVFLTADPMEKGVTKGRLTSLYKSAGFKDNAGSKRDFRSRAGMVREPATYDQQARGSITFTGDGRALIQLFQSRNLSTFLHETGHLWLEELKADASSPDAPQQVRDDWAAVEKFLGLKPGQAFEVEHHEKFAETAERYFMEGRAPSAGLGAAFQRFKDWLVWIYKTVSSLGSPIDDNLRDVFDRLIATDEEIEAARDDLAARALFGSADQAGMTEAEFADYQRTVERSRDTAETELLRKVMAEVKARRTAAWKAEAAEVQKDVRAEVDQRPDLNALHYLRTGKTLDGTSLGARVRLSKDDLLSMYGGPGVLDALPKGVPPVYTDKGGAHPDALAEMFGFGSGRELVDALLKLQVEKQALLDSGDKRSVREVAIVHEVERVMGERHGDILNDGSIEQEARDALHNDERLTVLAVELRALARKVGKEPSALAIVRKWAARSIGEKPAREASDTAVHMRAERRAGRAVEAALLKGDTEEAYRQKQQQMISHALYVEAKRARADLESGRAMLDRYAGADTIASMDQDYLEQIHGLLEGVSLRPESKRDTAKRQALRAFVAKLEAEGRDVGHISAELINEAQRRNFNELSMDELRGLVDAVKQIAHLGRLKKKLMLAKEEREFDEAVTEAVGVADQQPRAKEPADERGMTEWQKKVGRPGQVLRSADASLLKIETIVDWLDRGTPNGPWNRYVFRPLADAQSESAKLRKEKLEGFGALMKALPEGTRERWQERLVLTGLENGKGETVRLLRSELVAVALNLGTESSYDKLLRGEKWDAAALQANLDRYLTKDDWQYIRGVWDLLESLWPATAELERRVNGVEPEKLDTRTIDTPFGPVAGGYYPAVYDPKRSFDVDVRHERGGEELFGANYFKATTPQGRTKARVEGYARPFWLSLEIAPRAIVEAIHDITHREAVIETSKFLSDSRVRKSVEGALGREYYKQFEPWLASIANEYAGDKKGVAFWEAFLKALRTNTTLVGMGFRASTILAQVGGLSDSTEYLGPRWMASGLKAFASNPAEAYRFVTGKSTEMAGRLETVDRDVRDQARALMGKDGVLDHARRFAFYGIGMMDLSVSLPTWLGAFNKAQAEGMTEDDAVYAADKAVRTTQGAGSTKDLAAVSRKNEFWRIATMFYSYFSHLYQRQRTLARDAMEADSVGDYAMIVARSFWLLVVPALMGAFLGGQGPEDDEDAGLWALRKVAFNLPMGVPIVRDVASGLENAISGKYRGGYQYTPAARALETFVKVGADVKNLAVKGEVSEGFLKRAMELPGYALGLPTGQLGNTSQFLWDVFVDHDQNPRGLKDWLDGLVYGGEKKK